MAGDPGQKWATAFAPIACSASGPSDDLTLSGATEPGLPPPALTASAPVRQPGPMSSLEPRAETAPVPGDVPLAPAMTAHQAWDLHLVFDP